MVFLPFLLDGIKVSLVLCSFGTEIAAFLFLSFLSDICLAAFFKF